jgi:tRNA threonylcarbamoyladenosine biosynthesis protein TsaB
MNHWLLTLDASTPTTVVALGRSDSAVPEAAVVSTDGANQTSEKLTEHLDHVLRSCDITMSNVGAIAAGVGPGTFTGTRVTAAFAKGLAVGLGQPLYPVSTLEALAWDARQQEGSYHEVAAMLDARRGEIYGAVYEWSDGHHALRRRGDERCISLSQFISDAQLAPTAVLIGTGVQAYREELNATHPFALRPTDGLSAPGLWGASRHALQTSDPVAPEALAVTYLRASYAEMGIHKPKRPMIKSPFV